MQLCTVLDINFDENQSLKHVLLPAILGINCLFQTDISCLEIIKPALALQVWHGTGNTRRQICVHTYCTSFHTLLYIYKLTNSGQHKLSNFTDFVDSIAILSLRAQTELHMLQILCEIWIECSLKHSKKNLPKINKIEATSDSVSRSGAVSRTGG